MHELYDSGKTCTQIAAVFGITRQSVWDRFRRRGYKLRPCPRNMALPFIEWGGRRWAPEKDGYFRCTTGKQNTARELLHRAKWIAANGRIPRGHCVIFLDNDRMNVELDNLDCVPKSESIRVRPIKIKPCLACGRLMGRRATGAHPEGAATYAKRQTCNAHCSAEWKRGKPRGARMPR